jgi:hypothetical protein
MMRNHFTSYNKKENIGKDEKKLTISYLPGENVKWYSNNGKHSKSPLLS